MNQQLKLSFFLFSLETLESHEGIAEDDYTILPRQCDCLNVLLHGQVKMMHTVQGTL